VLLISVTLIVVFTTRKSSAAIPVPGVSVKTKSGGVIEGVIRTRTNGFVSEFFGVPYSLPPVKDLRFKKALIHPELRVIVIS